MDDYINELRNNISLKRPMKICLDSGNGVGGVIAPQAFKAIGCEVIELFSEVDGNFPNHHPDPSNPKNLEDLQSKIKESNADVGIALMVMQIELELLIAQGKLSTQIFK